MAAVKFGHAKGQKTDAVKDAVASMFPPRILENISLSLSRTVPEDEALERFRYKSRSERSSLFLQMSSLIQKRDSLILGNYTDKELQKKIAEQDKEIQELRNKIDENLQKLKAEEEKYEKFLEGQNSSSHDKNYLELLKNIFSQENEVQDNEKITLYRNDSKSLFQPSEKALNEGFDSAIFEKETVSAGIDGILSGTIASYGDFISLTVEIRSYPGAKKIGSVTEMGNLSDADYISKSIARQLVPLITNSLPINVKFFVEPESLRQKTSLYVDEQFFSVLPSNLVLESGVHRLEFYAEGYERISTSYFFEGNRTYDVRANMEEEVRGKINVNLMKAMEGKLYSGGLLQKNVSVFEGNDGKLHSDTASISVNGKAILGEFIATDGEAAFFYVPQELLKNNGDFKLKIKTFDRSKYIEKQRKNMYRAYSVLVVSLIPSIFFSGQYKSYDAYVKNNATVDDEIIKKWQVYGNAKKITSGIAISCGAWFAVEFVRYLLAANTVLPAKAVKDRNFVFYESPDVKNDAIVNDDVLGDAENVEFSENDVKTESVGISENEISENNSYDVNETETDNDK